MSVAEDGGGGGNVFVGHLEELGQDGQGRGVSILNQYSEDSYFLQAAIRYTKAATERRNSEKIWMMLRCCLIPSLTRDVCILF